MKKLLIGLTLVVSTLMFGLAVMPIGASATAVGGKVFVCKYVSTPGGGETLQGGNNPISTDVNSIPSYDPNDPAKDEASELVGDEFSDGQGRSLVLVEDTGQVPEPDVNDCPPPNPPPPTEDPSASLTTPICTNQNIVATGVNPTDASVTFDVFVNGVLVDSFIVTAGSQGSSASIPVKDNDVVTVKVQGGETVLDTETVDLNCVITTTTPPPVVTTPPPVTGGSCPGSAVHGPWYGDPVTNITLKGSGTFVVSGGIQRFSGIRQITKTLACNETFLVSRYKVKRGHTLNITLNGVSILSEIPPVTHVAMP